MAPLLAGAAAFVLARLIFCTAYVPTGSMAPAIPEKSFIVCWRLSYLVSDPVPECGDIVIFSHECMEERLVKRVIGCPGDTIEVVNGRVWRNGEKLDEPYLGDQVFSSERDGIYEVPEGKLFMMGDNRDDSYDGRYWQNHYVDVHDVFSKIIFRIG